MKIFKIIIFSFCCFVFLSNVFAQEIQKNEGKVDSLFTLVKKITLSRQSEGYNAKLKIDNNDLEKAKKLLYEAYAYTPIEFEKKLHQWTQNWRGTSMKVGKVPTSMRPGVRLGKIKKAISEKYGEDFVRFLETPYFMKVKILNISSSTFLGPRNMKLSQIDLKVEILDVLKGKNFYSVGDTITIGYLPFWFFESPPPKFETNGIYAMPLKYWSNSKKQNHYNLMMRLNGLQTLYKIENNIVYNPLAPKINSSKTWHDFKHEFIQKFIITK